MSLSHLDRLLFAQGGRCFFCQQALPRNEASIEHLVASANGGNNSDDNCVACCRTLNSLLGSKSIKDKLQIVLNQRGVFRCPRTNEPVSASTAPKPPSAPKGGPTPQSTATNPSVAVHETPPKNATPQDIHQMRVDLILEDLRKRGNSRPRKEATLLTTIQALIKQRTQQPISEVNLKKLLDDLQQRGHVSITEGKVAYKL